MKPAGIHGAAGRAHQIAALLRYGLYASLIVMLWWALTQYAFVRIEGEDTSISGISGLRRLLVERLSNDEPDLERGEVVVFAMLNAEDEQFFRISRVIALPGDRVDLEQGIYRVNGEPTGIPRSDRVELTGVVPEGFYFLANDNRLSPYPDSLNLGLLDGRCIIGRFLSEMPF